MYCGKPQKIRQDKQSLNQDLGPTSFEGEVEMLSARVRRSTRLVTSLKYEGAFKISELTSRIDS